VRRSLQDENEGSRTALESWNWNRNALENPGRCDQAPTTQQQLSSLSYL
jgi:hypothetical protein